MATPIGTNVVTAIARRHIIPEVTDNIYNSNPIFFRLNAANKKIVRGGTQIEAPLMYSRFESGGAYSGLETLTVTPSDTIKNAAWDWKQYYVTVTIDGLTMIKTDQPEAIANFIMLYFAQAEMEMVENLAFGLWSDGVTNTKEMDGLKGAVDDSTVLTTYGGLSRSTNTWWRSTVDSATATLTATALRTFLGNVSEGGKHPTLLASRQEQYNRMWVIGFNKQEYHNLAPGTYDQQLLNAGFTNILFDGIPWIVDSHVFDGPNTSNSAIVALTEDFLMLGVSPRADFYLEDFQTPVDQDGMVAKMLWAGNLVITNCARQGKMTALTA